MRQWRILHTESSLGWGGQEWRVFLELNWMRQRGHQVWLAAPQHSEVFQRSVKAGIPTLEITFQRSSFFVEAAQLVKFIARENIDIVNTHSSRDGWLGGIASRLARAPIVIRSRHIEVDYDTPLLARIAFEFLADYVLTTSAKIRERLVREVGLDPSRVECLPTGVDFSRFSPDAQSTVREELGLADSIPLVGMIAVLRSWKGHADFIQAARLVLEKKPETHFIIAGGGPGRDYVLELITEANLDKKISFLGYREDIPEILAALSMLVLPSIAHEGIPQVILQAQAMGKPVIGSNIGGIPDVVEDGVTGLLVPPQNPQQLANAIVKIIDNPAKARQMALAARQRARSNHSLDAMGTRLEELYLKLFKTT
jgi:glycosyltransferase involved in cell wall biosynthesis